MKLEILPIEGLPEITPRVDLAQLITARTEFRKGDILVVAQKVISKMEGCFRVLTEVTPGEQALQLADKLGRDARLMQVVLDESTQLIRTERVLITETKQGFICANAGVDQSNVPGEDIALLLPEDCDRSATQLRARLIELSGIEVAVIISDSFGRPWRRGLVNVALGVAGLAPLVDYRGQPDDFARELKVTEIAVADELAAAAELVMGKTERVPAAIIRGFPQFLPQGMGKGGGRGQDLLRAPEEDLFR